MILRKSLLAGLIACTLQCTSSPVQAQTTGDMAITSDTTLSADHLGIIRIRADNVTLDCAGHSVTSDTMGINVDSQKGVTVKNCVVNAVGYGIFFQLTDGSAASGNRVLNSFSGIQFNSSTNFAASGNELSGNDYGIQIALSGSGLLAENTVESSVNHEVVLYGSTSIHVIDNVLNGAGLRMHNSTGNTVSGNAISLLLTNRTGIDLVGSSDSFVQDNTIVSSVSAQRGIALQANSSRNSLDGNRISGMATGVILRDGSSDNLLSNNEVTQSSWRGLSIEQNSDGNRVSVNTFDSNTGSEISLVNASDNTVSDNLILNGNHGIYLLQASDRNRIVGNLVSGGFNGIRLQDGPSDNEIEANTINSVANHSILLQFASTVGNAITGNVVNASGSGVALSGARLSLVAGNEITNMAQYALQIGDVASDNIVQGNTFQSNHIGLIIATGAFGNEIYNNNFINNTNQATIQPAAGANMFSLPAPIGGNYWDTYDEASELCVDEQPADGFCDQPYFLGNGEDLLPWTAAYGWLDSDGDGWLDADDNCPDLFNPEQTDINADGLGDLCVPPETVAPGVELGVGSTVGAGSDLKNGVTIGENAEIGANVTVEQNVIAGADLEVGDGTVINRDVTLGDQVSLGAGTFIAKSAEISDGVTIGNNVIIEKGVFIGADTWIGDETTVKKEAIIGANVIIGARVIVGNAAVIADGSNIPDDFIVPAGAVFP